MRDRSKAGSKFEDGLDQATIAKRIRQDIKNAHREGVFPNLMGTSVRLSRYSGGCSITISVTKAPFLVLNPKHVEQQARTPHVWSELEIYSSRARDVLERLETIGEAYRFDESDRQADYFHCNFYLNVRFETELETEEREMMLAAFYARAGTK